MLGGAVEALAALERHHPGDSALVEPRLDRDEDADDEDHHRRGDHAQGARNRRAEPAQGAHQLAAELVDPDPALDDAEAVAPGENSVALRGDDLAQPLGLADQLGAGEIEGPDDEADGRDGDDGEAPAAADRKHPAEQPGAAVEHRGQDDSGEDEQQRLGEEDQAGDGEGEAEPDAGPLQLLADQRVAHLGRAGLLDMEIVIGRGARDGRRIRGRRRGVAAARSRRLALGRAKRSAGAAAAHRRDPADRVEILRRAVEREGDELGAAADILPRHGAAEAVARAGRPGCRPICRDCRPAPRRGRRAPMILGKSSTRGS